MNDLDKAYQWIEAGKQIGKQLTCIKAGKTYWASVAVQKWNGAYKFYYDEIEEARIVAFDEEHEEIIETVHIEELQTLISTKTPFSLTDLTPLKGQRIFNPSF